MRAHGPVCGGSGGGGRRNLSDSFCSEEKREGQDMSCFCCGQTPFHRSQVIVRVLYNRREGGMLARFASKGTGAGPHTAWACRKPTAAGPVRWLRCLL